MIDLIRLIIFSRGLFREKKFFFLSVLSTTFLILILFKILNLLIINIWLNLTWNKFVTVLVTYFKLLLCFSYCFYIHCVSSKWWVGHMFVVLIFLLFCCVIGYIWNAHDTLLYYIFFLQSCSMLINALVWFED